jgi:undecaprenyl diphosphate synthase
MSFGNDLPQAAANLDLSRLPRHVAIIMDGNGRWAKKRGFLRVRGHLEGVESVRVIVRLARRLGLEYLTLYAFSDENWQRPTTEIRALMNILVRFVRRELPELMENQILLRAIGDLKRLPENAQRELARAEETSREGAKMTLSLALSYGGRNEIVQAAQSLARDIEAGKLRPEDINPESFASRLFTAAMPDPDLLIRTSGEYRLSNFLLWQTAYTELYFTDTLWPDFREEEFIKALQEFQHRDRRFGRTQEQVEDLVSNTTRH